MAVGVAVKKGSPKPDISDKGSRKENVALGEIHRVPGCVNRSCGWSQYQRHAEKNWGIDEQVEPKLESVLAAQGRAEQAAARWFPQWWPTAKAEIGMTFISEMNDPGIDIVGPLPKGSIPRDTARWIYLHALRNPEAAKARLKFLSSLEALAAYKAAGDAAREVNWGSD